jgi:hypothetical protein
MAGSDGRKMHRPRNLSLCHESSYPMRMRVFVRVLVQLLCVSLLIAPPQARADTLKTDAVLIVVGIALISTAIGIGIYYVARRNPTIKGCAVSGSGGVSLQNEGDQQTYLLIGDTAAIMSGDRVKVSGKKRKGAPGSRGFLVEKVSRDYGPCKVALATP